MQEQVALLMQDNGDVIFVALPDTKQARVYEKDIAPNLVPGKTLLFSHGFSIHFKTIVPPKNVDVILVAPKGPGHIVRRQYVEGKGVPSLIAVYQNPSRQAKKVALAWAKGIGATRAGVIETTFKEETETDLFGEQTVLCGGLSALTQAGYETLVEAGYQPEMAYFECLHELKLIVDLMNEAGISGMRFSVSETAKWGDVSVGPKIIDPSVKKRMKAALKDIQSGKFAKGWIAEYKGGYKKYNALLKKGDAQLRKAFQHTADDHAAQRHHLLDRMSLRRGPSLAQRRTNRRSSQGDGLVPRGLSGPVLCRTARARDRRIRRDEQKAGLTRP